MPQNPPIEYLRGVFCPIKNENIKVVHTNILEIISDQVKYKEPLIDL